MHFRRSLGISAIVLAALAHSACSSRTRSDGPGPIGPQADTPHIKRVLSRESRLAKLLKEGKLDAAPRTGGEGAPEEEEEREAGVVEDSGGRASRRAAPSRGAAGPSRPTSPVNAGPSTPAPGTPATPSARRPAGAARSGSPSSHGGNYRGPGDNVGQPTSGNVTTDRSFSGPSIRDLPVGGQGQADKKADGQADFVMGRGLGAAPKKESPDGKKGKSGKEASKRWKRSKGRPSFARVYVGGGNSLELERMRVTVRVEGARARTVVDHVFKNPHDKQLEGTFEYPLPAGASVCYYGMYLSPNQKRAPEFFDDGTIGELPPGMVAMLPTDDVLKKSNPKWGELRVARVVKKETARKVYEEIVRRSIDPALLEYAGGNTFRGRVFPIPPKGFNRVVIAYEETIDVADGKLRYRFALPDCKLGLLHVTGTTAKASITSESWSPGKGAARKEHDGRIVYEHAWEAQAKGPGGELVWDLTPKDARVQTVAGKDPSSAQRAFYTRVRPELPSEVKAAFAKHAVFLLDTSLSEDPDRFNVNVAILREILEQDTSIAKFNVACFDVGAWWLAPGGWVDNDAEGRKRLFGTLDKVLLEGATDLGAAFDLLAKVDWDGATKTPLNVFLLSDGQINWGDRKVERHMRELAAAGRFDARYFCYRTGLSAENLQLFAKLTRKGGGVFNAFTTAMAKKVALAHRRTSFVVDSIRAKTDAGEVRDLVVAGRKAAVFPGGELVVAGRCAMPAESGELIVDGSLGGERKQLRFALDLRGKSDLAARGWAEIAVQQMLALEHPEVEMLAAAYAQRFRIGSRLTSFLVLEKDSDYVEFGIDKEADALAVDDMTKFLDERWRRYKLPTRRVRFGRFLREATDRTKLIEQGKDAHVRALFAKLEEKDFELPRLGEVGALPTRALAAKTYLEGRAKKRRNWDLYLDESKRRLGVVPAHGTGAGGGGGNRARVAHGTGAGGGAGGGGNRAAFSSLRALSSLVELNPGRSDALRLVGYRLLAMEQPGLAARLFDDVREQRPFEPHSYRDLARSLEAIGKPGLAAIYYELLLAGKWHNRFGDSLKTVAADEYARMMQHAIRAKQLRAPLVDLFGQRLEKIAANTAPAKLRVTATWNSDGTDVDLWVVEPSGEACGYNHMKTKSGGQLLDDLTGGYGPERYQNPEAPKGEYTVLVKYYSPNANLIAGETHVDVVVSRHAGMPEEETRRFTVVLRQDDESVEVCKVTL